LNARVKLVATLIAVLALGAAASAAVSLAAGGGSRKSTTGCPAALPRALDDATGAMVAARTWGLRQQPRRFVVGLLSMSPYSLGTEGVWRNIARQQCGARVASRSWVAFYFAPARAKSADLAEGVVFFARTTGGWKEWYAYR
jgi:hypothetical protein